MKYQFDWAEFTAAEFAECYKKKGCWEDRLCGFLLVTCGEERFIVDIHYEYYGVKDCGFDLEIYRSSQEWAHKKWLTSIKSVRNSVSYERFCRRAEKAIGQYLASYEAQCDLAEVS